LSSSLSCFLNAARTTFLNLKLARCRKRLLIPVLENVFKPFPSGLSTQEENEITDFLDVPFQMELPHCKFKTKEIKQVIMKEINIKKAPGFDLISGKVLQELSEKCYKLIQLQRPIFEHVVFQEWKNKIIKASCWYGCDIFKNSI
jgi:hypothetical protein